MGRLRWIALLAPLGCAPTYAPPIRSPMMGAPGRVHHGDVELGGGAAGYFVEGGASPPVFGGPALSVGVSRLVAIEAGGEFTAGGWAMGFAGARVTGRRPVGPRLRLVGDTEIGIGGGVGGTYCTNGDSDRCDDDGR
ncbi:MAG TPA: hypothetical protein VG755_19515, partial [Nannocystaceae bacterium]|nr:hypothetical protein [Nannocystaceae bacterium]